MTKAPAAMGRIVVFIVGALMFARGIVILFGGDSAGEWSNILGTGGLADVTMQSSLPGQILRIAQIIEGRLWIIAVFPLFFRLQWGRDVAILVALLGMGIQTFRLLAGSDVSAVIWLIIYVGIAVLFYAEPRIKAYFAQSQSTET